MFIRWSWISNFSCSLLCFCCTQTAYFQDKRPCSCINKGCSLLLNCNMTFTTRDDPEHCPCCMFFLHCFLIFCRRYEEAATYYLSAIKSCLLKWAELYMYLFSDKIIFCSFTHKLIAFLSAVSDFWSDVFFYCRCDHLSIVCLLKIIWLHCYILLLQFLSCCVIQLSLTPKKCVVNFAVLIPITEINCTL